MPHRPACTWEGSARPAGCRAWGVGVAPELTLTQVPLESDPAALGLELSVKSPFVPSAQPQVHIAADYACFTVLADPQPCSSRLALDSRPPQNQGFKTGTTLALLADVFPCPKGEQGSQASPSGAVSCGVGRWGRAPGSRPGAVGGR